MKRIILVSLILSVILACTKQNPTPDGPSDIRIRNITDSDFTEVYVDIGDDENEGEHNYGSLAKHSETEYYRFEIAYPDATITLKIGGETFTTGVPDNTYAVPIQQGKFTYEVWIATNNTLAMRVIADAPLDDM